MISYDSIAWYSILLRCWLRRADCVSQDAYILHCMYCIEFHCITWYCIILHCIAFIISYLMVSNCVVVFGARAVSHKTPIYFMYSCSLICLKVGYLTTAAPQLCVKLRQLIVNFKVHNMTPTLLSWIVSGNQWLKSKQGGWAEPSSALQGLRANWNIFKLG